MAIYHCSMKPISRSSGRSAVASAAYRCAAKLTNERDGITHDFTAKQGVEHCEIVLPEGVNAEWAQDRAALWNAAEFAEKRKDARVAREFEIALPFELSPEARLEITRSFAQDLANRYGTAVDFAIHRPHDESDVRNIHAHVMMTTRQVGEAGLGDKTYIERENKWLLSQGLATTDMQLRDIRQSWESIANERLAREGLDVRIDHRSHAELGFELVPTEHMGVHATQMQRRGMAVDRGRLDDEAFQHNADLIREKPEQVLTLVSNEKSVFDRHDIARTLHRYINNDAQQFQNAFASVMASPALVELQGERIDRDTGEVSLARYSTREMVELESTMSKQAARLADASSHGVDRRHVDQALGNQDAAIRTVTGDRSAGLSDEQRNAIRHVTGRERISAVVGFAGAGKSTMLAAARDAWEAQGYRVHGAALSGKAAEGLEESSGIASRTLASWSRSWQNDRRQLGQGDVFVIDEAGMIGSRQLAHFIDEAETRGAKIVLVGDHEQLQAIGAGAPFRAIAEQVGHVELSDIRRQREDWQREASVSFATHKTADGLAAYRDNGNLHFAAGRDETRDAIVHDYLADREQHPDGSRVAMAHRRVDVRAINEGIRSELQDRGELASSVETGELTFQTNDGERRFAPDDRIVFLENNRDLGVKNGMLGTVVSVQQDALQVQLDGKTTDDPRVVTVPMSEYQAVDHGYATTIHKNQGATVDRAFVFASGTMDRHLTYVAMTRHRDGVELYAAADEFAGGKGLAAGTLIEHGAAPYDHKAENRESYFVTLENAQGERHTTWGVDLQRAISEAQPEIGDRIGLRHEGSEPVRLPDGTEAERNAWTVMDADHLAYEQLESRLSRSGVKETTLDYRQDFAERRGIAEQFGVASEIEVPRDLAVRTQDYEREATKPDYDPKAIGEVLDRVPPAQQRSDLNVPEVEPVRPEPEAVERQTDQPRRSMFDGLKLNARATPAVERDGKTPSAAAGFGDRPQSASGFERAVDGYARAYSSAQAHVRQDLPLLEGQKQELRTAGASLDQARPGSHNLMRSALQHDPKTAEAMTNLSGRERVGELVAGMGREKAALADPNVRADRFVQSWKGLQDERQRLSTGWHADAREKVEDQMRGLAKGLDQDPQMAAALRSRGPELGIGHQMRQNEKMSEELQRSLTHGRSLGLGFEL